MPMYEYLCKQCGKQFEIIQKFSDEPLTTHPDCGGPVERLLSAPALQFKGSGWYITDYARSGSSGSGKNGKSESSSESKSDSSKSETKASESKPAATSSDSKS